MPDDDILNWYKDRSLKEQLGDPAIRPSPPMPTMDPLPPKAELKAWNPDPMHSAYKGAAEGIAGFAKAPTDIAQSGIEGVLNTYYGRPGPALMNAAELAAMGIGPKMSPKGMKAPIPRELDNLGFYSQALEAAKAWPQAKGTAEQALQHLKSNQVKDAEIAATGLPAFLQDRPSITRDDLINHLRENRVGLNEGKYGGEKAEPEWGMRPRVLSNGQKVKGDWEVYNLKSGEGVNEFGDKSYIEHSVANKNSNPNPKWSEYSLDPSNPSYRESVLHLPHTPRDQVKPTDRAAAPYLERWNEIGPEIRMLEDEYIGKVRGTAPGSADTGLRIEALEQEREALHSKMVEDTIRQSNGRLGGEPFNSGHWDEPNVMAHMRTSLQKDAEGRPVFLLDELQSDWGQKLRDGGARDEAKIAELEKRYRDAETQHEVLGTQADAFLRANSTFDPTHWQRKATRAHPGGSIDVPAAHTHLSYFDSTTPDAKPRYPADIVAQAKALSDQMYKQVAETKRFEAEWRQAQNNNVPGHPLVNTTDQWTTTAMRRLLQQAAEHDVAGVAITPGSIQNERFGLGNHVSEVRIFPPQGGDRGEKTVALMSKGGGRVADLTVDSKGIVVDGAGMRETIGKPLSEVIGKDLAEQALGAPIGTNIAGQDLHFGGEGMRYSYDQMYPKHLEKILKKLDKEYPGRGETKLLNPREGERENGPPRMHYDSQGNAAVFHHFPLTPAVKEQIKKGLPLFSAAAAATPLAGTLLDKAYGTDQ